jgi:hypothetical protein
VHVLLVARDSRAELQERWAKLGIGSSYVPSASVLDVLRDSDSLRSLTADAIVIVPDDGVNPHDRQQTDHFGGANAVLLSVELQRTPDEIAMPDGRKWKAVPTLVFSFSPGAAAEAAGASARVEVEEIGDVPSFDVQHLADAGAAHLKEAVRNYRRLVLDELDNLGFIVEYQAGRYRVGPALKPRAELSGQYYFGSADRRPETFVTVDRDLLGVQTEVELFEALINRPDVSEAELQEFLEQNPHFLSVVAQCLPHVRLEASSGLLIPDFILRPLVAMQRDSRWEILDLKKPQVLLLVGAGTRRRLSHEVMKSIRQLRDYGDYFADPRNASEVESKLGHRLRRPKLGVLIGRLQNVEFEALETEQNRIPDVRIITYDEILETQKALM